MKSTDKRAEEPWAMPTDVQAAMAALPSDHIRPLLAQAMQSEAQIVSGVAPEHLAADRMVVLLAGHILSMLFVALTGEKLDAQLIRRSALFQMGMGLVQQVATMPDFPDVPGFPFTQAELKAAWETFRDVPEEVTEPNGDGANAA